MTGGWWIKCGGILLARAGNRWSRVMILGRDCLDELEVCRLIRRSLDYGLGVSETNVDDQACMGTSRD